MFVYWSIFAFPAAIALVTGPRSHARNALNTAALILTFLMFVIVIGLRYEIGADWFNYENIVAYTSYEDLWTALTFGDPGFSLVAWISAKVGAELYGSNLVCGTILVVGLVGFCRRQDDVWLALTASVPYLVIVVGMGYVRQSAAIGFILMAIGHFERGAFTRSGGWVVAAALFHSSAICVAPLFALAVVRKRVALVIPLGIATTILFATLLSGRIDAFYETYIAAEYDSSGALVRLLMNAVPAALFILYRKRFPGSDWSRALWLLISILSLALAVAATLTASTTIIDRIGLYFIPIQLYVFGNLALVVRVDRRGRFGIGSLVIFYYGLILFIWLNFATHAEYWVPYRILPFEI